MASEADHTVKPTAPAACPSPAMQPIRDNPTRTASQPRGWPQAVITINAGRVRIMFDIRRRPADRAGSVDIAGCAARLSHLPDTGRGIVGLAIVNGRAVRGLGGSDDTGMAVRSRLSGKRGCFAGAREAPLRADHGSQNSGGGHP